MLLRVGQPVPRTLEELMPPSLSRRIDRLDVLSRKIFAGKLPGERRSKRRGRSVEFDDFRVYSPGDDLRHIDWNVYARLDRLMIKLFREDEDLALHVVVDQSASMLAGEPSKLVTAHRLAMALAYIGLVKQNRVSVAVFGAGGGAGGGVGVKQLAPMRGKSNLRRASDFLIESLGVATTAGVGGGANLAGEFNAGLRRVASARRGRGVMVVLSDFLVPGGAAAMGPALAALAAAGSQAFDTHLVQVLAPAEMDPSLEREQGLVGDLRLTDAESGMAAEVTVSAALLARYKKTAEAACAALRRAALARGLSYFRVPSDTAVETVILDSLRRGGILR